MSDQIKNNTQLNIAMDNAKVYAVQKNVTEIYYNSHALKKRLTPFPSTNSCFIGREKDKKEVVKELVKKHKVLLNGLGGLGKTALAKEIYFDNESRYDFLAWVSYSGDWKESLLNSMFLESFCFQDETEVTKYNIVYETLTNIEGSFLLVIDNFNVLNVDELESITKLPADILITSRCHFVGLHCYTLDLLDKEECLKLFKHHLSLSHYTFKEENIIYDVGVKTINKFAPIPIVP